MDHGRNTALQGLVQPAVLVGLGDRSVLQYSAMLSDIPGGSAQQLACLRIRYFPLSPRSDSPLSREVCVDLDYVTPVHVTCLPSMTQLAIDLTADCAAQTCCLQQIVRSRGRAMDNAYHFGASNISI